MLRTILIYGVALALAAAALQWIEYQVWVRAHPGELYFALAAGAFLALEAARRTEAVLRARELGLIP